jgi:O-acetyl-ADP-ribose deacetylase (regulator of RNase III)
MHLGFFDCDKDRIRDLESAMGRCIPEHVSKLSFVHAKFKDLLKMGGLDATMSPANSLLFFDGGIDKAYQNAFANIQQNAQTMMRSFCVKSALDRPFLPVGSGIVLETSHEGCPHLIAVPTMFFPEDIRGTENVRHATWVALKLSLELGAGQIAIPCIGMGYGMLSGEECAVEITKALQMPIDLTHTDVGSSRGGCWYVRRGIACRQPGTYINTEVQA